MALRGNLNDVNVADLIQLNCQSEARAELIVTRDDGQHITLYFDEGEVVYAAAQDAADGYVAEGAGAVYALFTWDDGDFEVEQGLTAPERNVTTPWSALIMEGLRQLDELREQEQAKTTPENQEEDNDMAGETRREKLAGTLRNLIDTSGDISGVAVVSMDGLIMASDLPSTVEQARVGAVAAAILSLSGRSVSQLQRGDLQQTMIQGSDGYIIIMRAGPNAVLVALTSQSINLGMVFLEVRECAEAVADLLS